MKRPSPFGWVVLALALFWIGAISCAARAAALEPAPIPGALDRARTTTPVDAPLAISFTLINGRAEVFGCHGGDLDEARLQFNWFERNRVRVRFVDDAYSSCAIALGRPNVCWTQDVDWLLHRARDDARGWELATQEYAREIPPAILRDLRRTWPQWSDAYHPAQTISGPRAADLLDAPLCQ
jgi:hypothetical protein